MCKQTPRFLPAPHGMPDSQFPVTSTRDFLFLKPLKFSPLGTSNLLKLSLKGVRVSMALREVGGGCCSSEEAGRGRAVQLDPFKPTLKASGAQRLTHI